MVIREKESTAAVLIILLREASGDRILLTKRSSHLREHAGEVALPGGKREPGDTSLYRTALRETFEEVGLSEIGLQYVAELPQHYTYKHADRRSPVTPFVAVMHDEPALTLCDNEIESAFWLPTSLIREDVRSFTHVFDVRRPENWAPVYHHQGYEIWGFTARVLVSFANVFYGAQIRREHVADEVLYTV